MREREGAGQENVTEEVPQADQNRAARTAEGEEEKATDAELAILREAAQRHRNTLGLAHRILEKLRPKSRALAASKFSFFIAGLLIAVWATMVPYVKARLGLNEGELGALLLCFGLGSLFSMPVAGVLISEYGARTILRWTTPLTASMLALLAVAQGTVTMVVLLLLFGASYGALNVGASVHAAEVEKRSGKRMMSLIYAYYSMGGMIGAPVLALLLHSGLDLAFCAVAVCVFTILVWTELGHWLLPAGREKRSGGSAFVMPRGRIIFYGLVVFVIFLAEGAILDWGALFLSQTQGVALANAGIGYAFFSAAMLLMRLSGGPVIERIGPRAAVMGGAVLAGCAFAAAVLFENAYVTFLAFFVVGIGCSNISPLSYAEASRTRVMPMSQALAAVTILGYTGILTGPALLGFIAKVTSLPMVFLVVGALTAVVATAGGLYSGRTPKASGK